MCPENVYVTHARKSMERRYPHYSISFEEGRLNRVVSTFHAFRHNHHIIGEVHCVPLTSSKAMEQSFSRIGKLEKALTIDRENTTALVFSPKPHKGDFIRVRNKHRAFEKKTGMHVVLMPGKEVFKRRIKKLRRKKKPKIVAQEKTEKAGVSQ